MQQISKLVWPIYNPRQWGLGQVLCYNEYSLLAVTSNLVLIGNYEVAKECKEYYTYILHISILYSSPSTASIRVERSIVVVRQLLLLSESIIIVLLSIIIVLLSIILVLLSIIIVLLSIILVLLYE